MKNISDFLKRFSSLTPPNDALKRAVAEAVQSVAGVPTVKKDITLSHGVAFVRASSIAKSAIRINRGQILEQVFSQLPKARDTVRDIR